MRAHFIIYGALVALFSTLAILCMPLWRTFVGVFLFGPPSVLSWFLLTPFIGSGSLCDGAKSVLMVLAPIVYYALFFSPILLNLFIERRTKRIELAFWLALLVQLGLIAFHLFAAWLMGGMACM